MPRKYSLITTNPYNEGDKELFWDFRLKEILNRLQLLTRVYAVLYIVSLLEAILARTLYLIVMIVINTLFGAMLLAIWLLSKRYSKGYIYLFPIQYLVMMIALLAPSDPVAPGVGSVSVAAFPDASLIVPLFKASALVLV